MAFVKRAFDLILVIPGLIILLPLFLILIVCISIILGFPVFFRQERPGLNGKPFWLTKFRTMTNSRDVNGIILPDGARMTAFGRFLRSTSLDELPELFSVLKGDMSLIGPRPLLMKYLTRYTPEQGRRHAVKPGITGWAQVNGRNAITWERKFQLDVWYIDNWSLWLDIKIMGMTIFKSFMREGINQTGRATMEEFMGSKDEQI
jgi:lipopolysaccharide/colanic/teichoic acid biosynthesis glycosyltransferase